MTDIPQGIVLRRHRDLERRKWQVWVPRVVFVVLAAFVVTALLNVFGQVPSTVWARSSSADLELYAPASLRGRLLYETRLRIHAHRDIKQPILRLDGGWLEGYTLNTIEPPPLGRASSPGSSSSSRSGTSRPGTRTRCTWSSRPTRPTSASTTRGSCCSTGNSASPS